MLFLPIDHKLPLIVIVGRPNTGKSTLFNRLLKHRRTLTNPQPGVTRDFVEAEFNCLGQSYLLVDSGGFSLDNHPFQEKIKKQLKELIQQADLLLLVVEVDKLTPEDHEFIGQLRRFKDKIILVVNKVDNEERKLLFYQHYALGFERIVGISAEHNLKITELRYAIDEYFASNKKETPPADLSKGVDLKLAIMGKPNTGKSTLLNSLLNRERALTSELPGTTRDVIEAEFIFEGRRLRIYDTAGIRRKQRISEDLEYYSVNRAIETITKADLVILLIDAVDGFSEQDKKLAALVEKRGRPLILVINKCDLLPQKQLRKELKERIYFLYPAARSLPLVFISAKERKGLVDLLKQALTLKHMLDLRIETGALNRALARWQTQYHIPLKANIQLRYMTQVATRPARFVLFVNQKKAFPRSYLQYLKNRLREEFGFKYVPIIIELKESR